MLDAESLPVAEEEVVEASPNKLRDIHALVARGRFPEAMTPPRRKTLRRFAQKFVLEEGRLFYAGPRGLERREVVLEAERRRRVFLDCHRGAAGLHLGQKKTVRRVQSSFYWLGIVRDVVDWIKACETCRQAERTKSLARTVRPLRVEAPWDIVGIDFVGPLPESEQGSTSVTVLIDYFSKWPEAFPGRAPDALSVARCVSRCACRFGAPKTVVCAQSADFCEEVTRLLRERWSVAQKVSPLERPQLDPLHDRTAPLVRAALLRMAAERQAAWEDFLEPALFPLRAAVNATTGFSPYALLFNRAPPQTTLNPLDPDALAGGERASACLSVMEEQQDAVKQLVLANMNAAYRQEKKRSSKRRTADAPPSAPADPKRVKDDALPPFPSGGAGDTRAALSYRSGEPDVRRAGGRGLSGPEEA